jgi:type IV pilus assembly protein PilY1
MKLSYSTIASTARWTLLATTFVAAVASNAVTIPNSPLSVQPSAKPMIMLAMGKDHRMFYEAYNDASDIDGDGALDIRFKPTITYLGLFDSTLCYSHNDNDDSTGLFSPASVATVVTVGTKKDYRCPGKWGGNWLNYITTSRIDALRVVLYGGAREVDTATQTVLRRAYIPQDAHTWAKEYTSLAIDKYLITNYTPLAQPKSGKRHFFGNLTPNAGVNCANLNDCSDSKHPWVSVVEDSSKRVWEWASKERPVLDDSHGGDRKNRTVRVEVCTSTFNAGCKSYPNGKKPVGLFHDFGENEAALFGLMSGSYDKNFSGGRLRKVMSSFKDEVNQNNGVFTANATMVKTINSFRIRDFNNGETSNVYRGGFGNVTTAPLEGAHVDWGNPVGEIMYEAVRYLTGKGSATTAYVGDTTFDDQIGLPKPAWDKPYDPSSSAKAPWCARANLLTISDTNISFDSDQLPGVNSNFGTGLTSDIAGTKVVGKTPVDLSVRTIADLISANEPFTTGLKFIGQSGADSNAAPTPKTVASLSSIRGLAPEEPTKQGSYYAASVAHYAKTTDLQPTLKGDQSIDSFFVALASPLPRIEAKLPNGVVIALVPFAKSVAGGGPAISNAKTAFQPTNQIVDFYVDNIVNSGPDDADTSVNGGRYQAKFRINFEDVEEGADHDMDAIVEYEVKANADNTLDVKLTPIYQAGGISHRMGYIISGSTADGIHLVVQDDDSTVPYYLNVPPGKTPGYCDASPIPAECSQLPRLGGPATANSNLTKFSPGTVNAATFLKDPLWYAAKWGGFIDSNNNGQPDLPAEWDKDGNGVPDTYFYVQNPSKLKENLKSAFEAIVERNGSSSNIATNSSRLNSSSQIYQASFTAGKWSGDVAAFPITKLGISNTAVWNANAIIPQWNLRNIYMNTSSGVVDAKTTAYSALPTADKTALVSDDIYKYIKGDTSKELSKPSGTLRTRDGVLGDIIHSSPNFDPDTGNIYVGANDGMFHAFNSSTGVEKYAFVPYEAQARLKNLAATNYATAHEYFVDGDVSIAFKTTQTNSTKYLYSLLGRGGKGLFSANATAAAMSLLWEYTPAASTAAAADKDLGLMLGRPVFALLNNGKAALMVGNGYNSTDGKAVLYIFIINSNGTLDSVKKIDTGAASDNGLSGPAFVDTNLDGTADFVYAGDLKGNVWKFDISNASPSAWSVAYSNTPLFKAVDPSNVGQPITAPLYIAKNGVGSASSPNFGKYFIFFGTGSYFQTGDAVNTQIQSWYGIVDDISTIASRANLVERKINSQATIAGKDVRFFSKAVTGDMAGKRGWYMDLRDGTNLGERIVTRSQIIPLEVPALLVSSLYPVTGDVCTPGGDGFINFVNPFTGGAIETNIIDVNGDGKFDGSDQSGTLVASSIKAYVGIPTTPVFVSGSGSNYGSGLANPLNLTTAENGRYFEGNGKNVTGTETECTNSGVIGYGGSDGRGAIGGKCKPDLNNIKGRISWREILKD